MLIFVDENFDTTPVFTYKIRIIFQSVDNVMPYVRVEQKYQVTIPASVREEIGLHEGDMLEARVEDGHIVLVPRQMMTKGKGTKAGGKKGQPPLSSYIGAARGLYDSPQEVDDYIRKQRDEWQN